MRHVKKSGKKYPGLLSLISCIFGKITVCGLPFCPFVLLPLPQSLLSSSVKFSRLTREDIFCFCFHISVHEQISSTLQMFLLPAQMTTMTLFLTFKCLKNRTQYLPDRQSADMVVRWRCVTLLLKGRPQWKKNVFLYMYICIYVLKYVYMHICPFCL